MTFEQWPLAQSDHESIERFPHETSDDLAVSLAKGFERLEKRIDAAELRLCSRLAELEGRLATKLANEPK